MLLHQKITEDNRAADWRIWQNTWLSERDRRSAYLLNWVMNICWQEERCAAMNINTLFQIVPIEFILHDFKGRREQWRCGHFFFSDRVEKKNINAWSKFNILHSPCHQHAITHRNRFRFGHEYMMKGCHINDPYK